MAEITRKRTGELLRKLFEILSMHPEGLPAGDALKQLANSFTLTPYETGFYESSGVRRFEQIVRFATVDCVKAGWLIKNKGKWAVTYIGMDAWKNFSDAEAFYKEAVRLYHVWKDARDGEGMVAEVELTEEKIEDSSTDKSTSITFEKAEEVAWTEIEQFLRKIDPYELQFLVGDLLEAMGYYVSWSSPPGKDGGVDVIAYTDPIGTQSPRIKVQVKRRGEKVDADGIRSFISIISGNDVGLYVSIGGFTRDAEAFARSQESRKITLINLDKLVELWIQFYPKLKDDARRRLPLTPIYFLTPST
jgi:restriction system protein